MKIGNVGASATYTVTQTDRLDELESVSRKKIRSDGVYEEESESDTVMAEVRKRSSLMVTIIVRMHMEH